jgi:hypothetical protein
MVAACPYPARRGTPIRIRRLAEGMVALGHQVHVVTHHFGSGDSDSTLRYTEFPRSVDIAGFRLGPTWVKLGLLDPC